MFKGFLTIFSLGAPAYSKETTDGERFVRAAQNLIILSVSGIFPVFSEHVK